MKRRVLSKTYLEISSLVVAFYAIIPTLNLIMVGINPSLEGLMTSMYKIVGVLALLCALCRKSKKPNTGFFIVLFAIILAYVLTPDYGPEIELTLPYFLMFTLVPLILPQFVKIDVRLFSLFAMTIPSFGVLFAGRIFILNSENVISMDLCYSLLIPVVSAILYLRFFYKKDGLLMRILLLPIIVANVFYFFLMSFFGSRAPTASVVLCIFFLYIFTCDGQRAGIHINKKRLRRVVLILTVVVLSFMMIVKGLNAILSSYGLDSGSLEKLMRLSSEGDMSNGRGGLNQISWARILESPVFGYGLSSSPYVINECYPHNFILQLLLDGGLILTSIVMIPFFHYLKRFAKYCSKSDYVIISLLFFSSVIGALFSMDLWMNVRFWLFMGFLLSKNMEYNRVRSAATVRVPIHSCVRPNLYGKDSRNVVNI